MGSTSETGHAKNAANFNELVTRTGAIGAVYNPAQPALMHPQLKKQLAGAQNGLSGLAVAKAAFADMVDKREALYKPLPKLLTRVLNLFRSSVTNKAQTDTATHLADLMRGFTAKAKPLAGTEAAEQSPKTISTSRRSYDSIYENMEQFVEVLAANPAYNPNEPELAVSGLRTLLNEMKAMNVSADNMEIALDTARGLRNTLLYAPGSGLVDTATAVKQYVKGILTPDHAHYKAIVKLEFKRVG